MKHAHKVEEVFVLRRDLCTIRDHDSDTSQKLDDVTEELRKQQSLVSKGRCLLMKGAWSSKQEE